MKPKIFHCRTSKTGPTTPVTVRFTKYQSNDQLAVQLICAKAPWSPFATITVNIPASNCLSPDLAFVDTNNCPWAKEFLEENHIAKYTGNTGISGFCDYPLYKFNKDVIYEND
jgi:hypothetical protein